MAVNRALKRARTAGRKAIRGFVWTCCLMVAVAVAVLMRCGARARRRGGEEGKPEPNRVELRVQVIEGALPVMAKR